MNRRATLKSLTGWLAASALAPLGFARAADAADSNAGFPQRPVQLIVPYAAGGPTDLVARILADGLTDEWGQRVYVVNKPGASGLIGVHMLLDTPPDGYNLMLTASSAFVIYPALLDTAPYDSVRDFSAISTISYSDLILVVRNDLPVSNVSDLVSYIKAHPGTVSYGSAGIGALNHIGGALFGKLIGADLQHIPYKGDAPVILDLLNGNVTLSFLSADLAIPQINAGKLKPLAVTGPTRMAALPAIPTMAEAGVQGFSLRAWNAVVGPTGMPPALVARINQSVVQSMNRPAVTQRLAELGLTVETSTPQVFAQRLRSEGKRWHDFIKSAGIHLSSGQ